MSLKQHNIPILLLSSSKFKSFLYKLSDAEVQMLQTSELQSIVSRVVKNATASTIVAFFSNVALVIKCIQNEALTRFDFRSLIVSAYSCKCLGYIANKKELFKALMLKRLHTKHSRNFALIYDLCSTKDEMRALYRNFWLISSLIFQNLLSFEEFLENLKKTNTFTDFLKSEAFDEYFDKNIISDRELRMLWESIIFDDDFMELSKFCSHRDMFVYAVQAKLVDFGQILKLKDLKHIIKFVQKLDALRIPKKPNENFITDEEFYTVIHQIVTKCDAENNVRVFSGLQSSKELCEYISKQYNVNLKITEKVMTTECDELLESTLEESSTYDVVQYAQIAKQEEVERLKRRPGLEFLEPSTPVSVESEDSFTIDFLTKEGQLAAQTDQEFGAMMDKVFEEAQRLKA